MTSVVAQWQRILLPMQETRVQTLGWEDAMEKELSTHPSTLVWKIPQTEAPGSVYSPQGCKRVGQDLVTKLTQTHTYICVCVRVCVCIYIYIYLFIIMAFKCIHGVTYIFVLYFLYDFKLLISVLISPWRTPFYISVMLGLLVTNFICFLFQECLSFSFIFERVQLDVESLVDRFSFSFRILKLSEEKSTANCIELLCI